MTNPSEDFTLTGLATQRFSHFLELLKEQGYTQTLVAAELGMLPQYLSDVNRGQRPVTELLARRMGQEFDVNFEWLLGSSGSMENPSSQSKSEKASSTVWLPLFPHPIEGEPRVHSRWNGACVEVTGVAAAKLVLAKHPYVLCLDHDDQEGRLRQGDFLLISQAIDKAAQISVVRYRQKSFLARRNPDGSWRRVANENVLPAASPVTGHCVGILWSSLI
jgi:transcriptional regulator with XRE-family HTH domain